MVRQSSPRTGALVLVLMVLVLALTSCGSGATSISASDGTADGGEGIVEADPVAPLAEDTDDATPGSTEPPGEAADDGDPASTVAREDADVSRPDESIDAGIYAPPGSLALVDPTAPPDLRPVPPFRPWRRGPNSIDWPPDDMPAAEELTFVPCDELLQQAGELLRISQPPVPSSEHCWTTPAGADGGGENGRFEIGHLYVPDTLSVEDHGYGEIINKGGISATIHVNAPTLAVPTEDMPDADGNPHVMRPVDGVRAFIFMVDPARSHVLWTVPDERWGEAQLELAGGYSPAEMYELAKLATR